jgi:hypothetical protein
VEKRIVEKRKRADKGKSMKSRKYAKEEASRSKFK